MKWRSEMVLVVWLVSMALPQVVAAQGPMVPTPDPACACYVKPPDEPGEEPDPDSPTNPRNRKWFVLGAAGLAVLAGIPFGGTTVQGLPFAAAPELPGAQPAPVVAEAPVVELPTAAPAPVAAPAVPGVPMVAVAAPAPAELPPEIERAGMVPPKTATHLPLLGAMGVFMLGGGAMVARKGARERRRKKRFVAL